MKKLIFFILNSLTNCRPDGIKVEGWKEHNNRIPAHPHAKIESEEPAEPTSKVTSLHETAYKVAKYYVEIFYFADQNFDDKVDKGELKELLEKHGWPRYDDKNPEDMAEHLIGIYGNSQKGELEFANFINLLQNIWMIKAEKKVIACKKRIDQNMKIFQEVFKFLDGNGDEKLTRDEVKQGLSLLLKIDLPMDKVTDTFQAFSKND